MVAGFGGATFPPLVFESAARAAAGGIPVVLASRSTAGRVVMTPGKKAHGFLVCDNLPPQKARILLMLALTVTHDLNEIQQFFWEY